MGRKCSVEGCLSDSNRTEDIGVTFHKVPLHSDVRPKWMSLCHIPDSKKMVKIIYVCSRHFLRADFCNFKGKKYMLKQGVLPSVFPWDKSKLEAIKAEASIKKDAPEETPKDLKKEIDSMADETIKTETEVSEQKSELLEVLESEIKEEPKETLDEFEKSKASHVNDGSMKFAINTKIEALDFNNEWFPAKIIEVDYEENEVLIHFENFSNKYDEWISMSSPRLRLPANAGNSNFTEEFVVGERCLAAWSDARKFPATITKVMDNDSYEVLFDDGFVKVLKGERISKSNPLFDPIKSTKQDRREKKRKLNVAQLFRKRRRTSNLDDKAKRSPRSENVSPSSNSNNSNFISNKLQDETESTPDIVTVESSGQNWKIQWLDGKPVGTTATIETQDGVKDSIIVADHRLPEGWKKHLLKRTQGQYAGKWDVIILSPQYRRFRSRFEVKRYLDENPIEGVRADMFDFALHSKKRKGTKSVPKPVTDLEKTDIEENQESVKAEIAIDDIKQEEPENSLKIIYEDDAYKCPIEGCGKNFRKENLAQMHVKHYHPEYTKYLDSTPNVADLAYARTVGERLDSSPGPSSRTASSKPTIRSSTPKNKPQQSTSFESIETPTRSTSPIGLKTKDSEIIKLLNSKPQDKENEDIKPLPSGLPNSMYPEINLKDLLTKTEGVPQRDDINLKTLCSSRPPTGLKTLLPVKHLDIESGSQLLNQEPPKHPGRRKRRYSENIEIVKGKSSTIPHASNLSPQQITTPLEPTHTTNSPNSPDPQPTETPPQNPSTSTTSTIPPDPPNNIIIEGGEVIKIVRMKQEEIINCTCGFAEEDGLMIQCELCLCWQHAYCNNIERESQVPEKYVCYICQNPPRERLSRKYYHDQDWLKLGVLPVGIYHSRDEQILQQRFEKLRKVNDLCGGLLELRDYVNSLAIKMKIAGSKNHPKLYLWSKPWDKLPLPERMNDQNEDIKPKSESDFQDFVKDDDKSDNPNDSMLMMILKAGKEVIPKLDLNELMDTSGPIIPQPEAAIDSADCKIHLLEHINHQETLVEERLNDFEKQLDLLEEGMNVELDPDYPKTRHTLEMLLRDIETVQEFSQCTTI